MSRLRRPSPAFIVAVLALVVATAGATWAAIPSANGVIHACYSDFTGSLRVIDADARQKCIPHLETALSFNQTGPPGQAGAAGATGPTGATGPSGTASPLSIVQVSHSIANAGPGLAEVDATCPQGDTLTGGGAGDGLADARNSFVVASSPQYADSTTTWAVIFNLAGAGEDITAIAMCANTGT